MCVCSTVPNSIVAKNVRLIIFDAALHLLLLLTFALDSTFDGQYTQMRSVLLSECQRLTQYKSGNKSEQN